MPWAISGALRWAGLTGLYLVLAGQLSIPEMTAGLLAGLSAAALSLAFTGAFMVLLRVNHPPAGATTLIVALGILSTPYYLIVIEIAVVLLTAQAFVINRMAGLPYPLWQSAKVDEDLSQG